MSTPEDYDCKECAHRRAEHGTEHAIIDQRLKTGDEHFKSFESFKTLSIKRDFQILIGIAVCFITLSCNLVVTMTKSDSSPREFSRGELFLTIEEYIEQNGIPCKQGGDPMPSEPEEYSEPYETLDLETEYHKALQWTHQKYRVLSSSKLRPVKREPCDSSTLKW